MRVTVGTAITDERLLRAHVGAFVEEIEGLRGSFSALRAFGDNLKNVENAALPAGEVVALHVAPIVRCMCTHRIQEHTLAAQIKMVVQYVAGAFVCHLDKIPVLEVPRGQSLSKTQENETAAKRKMWLFFGTTYKFASKDWSTLTENDCFERLYKFVCSNEEARVRATSRHYFADLRLLPHVLNYVEIVRPALELLIFLINIESNYSSELLSYMTEFVSRDSPRSSQQVRKLLELTTSEYFPIFMNDCIQEKRRSLLHSAQRLHENLGYISLNEEQCPVLQIFKRARSDVYNYRIALMLPGSQNKGGLPSLNSELYEKIFRGLELPPRLAWAGLWWLWPAPASCAMTDARYLLGI
jgi:hypothetical protein